MRATQLLVFTFTGCWSHAYPPSNPYILVLCRDSSEPHNNNGSPISTLACLSSHHSFQNCFLPSATGCAGFRKATGVLFSFITFGSRQLPTEEEAVRVLAYPRYRMNALTKTIGHPYHQISHHDIDDSVNRNPSDEETHKARFRGPSAFLARPEEHQTYNYHCTRFCQWAWFSIRLPFIMLLSDSQLV